MLRTVLKRPNFLYVLQKEYSLVTSVGRSFQHYEFLEKALLYNIFKNNCLHSNMSLDRNITPSCLQFFLKSSIFARL